MPTLEIVDLPAETYKTIEKLARLRGKSVSQVAAEFLARAVLRDDAAEAELLDEIRAERDAMTRDGFKTTEEEITKAKKWGRA